MKHNLKVYLNGQEVFSRASLTTNFFDRLKGLLGTSELAVETPLIINNCSSVHSFFMKYPIGVIYLNSSNVVIDREILISNRVGKMHFATRSVIECRPEMFDRFDFSNGSAITFHS